MTYQLTDEEFLMVFNDDLDLYLNHNNIKIETDKLNHRYNDYNDFFSFAFSFQAWKILKAYLMRGYKTKNLNNLITSYDKCEIKEIKQLICNTICQNVNDGYDEYLPIPFSTMSKIMDKLELFNSTEIPITCINTEICPSNFMNQFPSIKKLKMIGNCGSNDFNYRYIKTLIIDCYQSGTIQNILFDLPCIKNLLLENIYLECNFFPSKLKTLSMINVSIYNTHGSKIQVTDKLVLDKVKSMKSVFTIVYDGLADPIVSDTNINLIRYDTYFREE